MSSGMRCRGTGSRPLLARTALSSLSSLILLSATTLAGCDAARPTFVRTDEGAGGTGAGGVASTGGTSTGSGVAGTGVIALPMPPCQLPATTTPVFAARVVSNDAPARRELYSWTTAEQAEEIRAGSVLLTRTEREGMGPGFAMEVLAALGRSTPVDPAPPDQANQVALAALLSGPDFDKARYAWTEPWATRMGWPGEAYGDQLVRMVLRPDAWLARYTYGRLDVVDMANAPVALADALAHPERLAGVFFVRDGGSGGPTCGSFASGDNGYREFIIGNEAMIEEWSLATSEIRSRLESDIALVQAFFDQLRVCPIRAGDAESWNRSVVCGWSYERQPSELYAYEGALAMPSPGYLPTVTGLATLIETLQAGLFEPDPFVVTPGQ